MLPRYQWYRKARERSGHLRVTRQHCFLTSNTTSETCFVDRSHAKTQITVSLAKFSLIFNSLKAPRRNLNVTNKLTRIVPCSNGVNCCPPTDNCYPDLGMCCVKGGVTCGYQECYQAGAVCCSETGACNAAQNQTCCDTPAKSGCCDSGYSCCPAANTCCADDHTCCAAGCCSPGVECQDGECVTPLPVLELPYTPLVLDATVKNMCLWIRTQNPTNPNQVTLKYSSVRNDGGKCAGCCRYVTVAPGSVYAGEPTSCDEAPFARTYEASDAGAHLACVDAYENSFQGWWFGQWVRYTRANVPGFGDGSQFIVQITKLDCSTVLESDLQGCGSSSPPAVTTVKLLRTRQNGGSSTSGSESERFPALLHENRAH
jgi:hypothetical protein